MHFQITDSCKYPKNFIPKALSLLNSSPHILMSGCPLYYYMPNYSWRVKNIQN